MIKRDLLQKLFKSQKLLKDIGFREKSGCFYILAETFDKRDSEKVIYIGESADFENRVMKHSSTIWKNNPFNKWDTVIFFFTKTANPIFEENRMWFEKEYYSRINTANFVTLVNNDIPKGKKLNSCFEKSMSIFRNSIDEIISEMGINLFYSEEEEKERKTVKYSIFDDDFENKKRPVMA